MTNHRCSFKRWKEGRTNFTTSFPLFEEDTVEIFLLENFPCNNSEELGARERHWIETIEGGCVNKFIPTRTRRQYYEQNREQFLERQRHYREQNQEQIVEQQREKLQCECGAEVRRDALTRHKRTQKHINALNK